MKKFVLNLITFTVLFVSVFAQTDSLPEHKTRVILVNPGVFYLKSLVYLTENKIIDIKNLEYLAVFYEKAEISIDNAKKYVEDNHIDYIKFQVVSGNLSPENLYRSNDCSDSFKKLVNESDGIIFLGGWDIPAKVYGQKTSLLTGIHTPNRHYFELSFLYHLLGRTGSTETEALLDKKPDYVVFGICLGMQSMNVATGGDMYQDIPHDIYGLDYVEDVLAMDKDNIHRSYWGNISTDKNLDNHSFHRIKFTDTKFWTKGFGIKKTEMPYVVSSHHQAVKNIGKGFKIIATSLDGKVVEGLKHKKYKNVLGVQFHPEFYTLHEPDSKKMKIKPSDTELMTEYEMMKRLGGYDFQVKYWKYFSSLFVNK
ncbi:MAG: gamma-glutamyl-gamma-aminobutyrate hydrolase family protein [Bacteroidales bacterium]|nr:gamma-glutamyl-gamma-aminobutyrate hydrolase family protein [Bacteroidales bacterium]